MSTSEWQTAYENAQEHLRSRHPRMLADAILWRATFLEALLGWGDFQARYAGHGELPTDKMLEVAATIPTFGDETSFDRESFEEHLADLAG